MPSLSPGDDSPSTFHQILPGAPVQGYQSVATLTFRWKRYIIYTSQHQLSILRSPTELVQAITHEDEELVAVVAEPTENGRFALASKEQVWVLKPVTSARNRVTWAKELLLSAGENSDGRLHGVCTLSWTAEGELLVGSAQTISLFGTNPSSRVTSPVEGLQSLATIEHRSPLWTKAVASAPQFCRFSPSANLIATSASHDRLVKIWRRLSFEEAIFDYAYLPHEGLVTHLEWRPAEPIKLEIEGPSDDRRSVSTYHVQDEQCEVLYTLASDAQLRIWRTNGHHDLDMLSLYTVIDLVSAIPHSPVLHTRAGPLPSRPTRYTFTIPSFAYSAATSTALKKQPQGKLRHSMEHVREVSSRSPDIVVAVDAQGRMSAWGVAHVGHKRRPTSAGDAERSPFHVAHSDDMGLQIGKSGTMPATFETWFDGDILNVIMHEFGVGVKWWQGNIEQFSSSAAIDDERGRVIATLTGCESELAGLSATANLSSLLAWSASGELDKFDIDRSCLLRRAKAVHLNANIHSADSVQRERSLVALCQNSINLARTTDKSGIVTASHQLPHDQQLRMLRIEDDNIAADNTYILYDDSGNYSVADINPTRSSWESREAIVAINNQVHAFSSLLDSHDIKTDDISNCRILLHPRKAAWLRLVAVTVDGLLQRRDVSIALLRNSDVARSEEQSVSMATPCTPGQLASVPDCAAILSSDGMTLLIADLKGGFVEHRQRLDQQAIGLTFARTAYYDPVTTEHNLLAVWNVEAVDILSPHKLTESSTGNQWLSVKSVSIAGIGSSIRSVEWLPRGFLAIATGSSILVADNRVTADSLDESVQQGLDLSTKHRANVLQLGVALGAPTVCWHSTVLRALVTFGHFNAVVAILRRLKEQLRFFTAGDQLDALLGLDFDDILASKINYDEGFAELNDKLAEVDLPFTSDKEQGHVKLIVRTVEYVLRFQDSLDTNAIKYLFEWRFRLLVASHLSHSSNKLPNGVSHHSGDPSSESGSKVVPAMPWREIVFAYHSSTQQPLLDALIQYYENKLDWPTVRSLGIAMWLHTIKAAQSEGASIASLEQLFDALGQNAYRASQPPNPADASLFLLALRKKAVLLSLWRVAIGNPEQKGTQNFLKRDFSAEEHRVAARKNAYALMGKRRFQYAAAFFVLADDVMSAVSILAGQCEDMQLAVAVARAYCGDDSTTVRQFLQDRVVASAKQARDRWMLHWALHIQGRHEDAAKALVVSFDELTEGATPKTIRSWHQDDPATLIVYRDLRDASRHASGTTAVDFRVSSTDEYRAVLRSARILRRQGLWLLALHVVGSWKFVAVDAANQSTSGAAVAHAFSTTEEPQKSRDTANLLDSFGIGTYTDVAAPAIKDDLDKISSGHEQDAKNEHASTTTADDRAAKAAELLAKMRAKKSAAPSAKSPTQEEKKQPTQFKEPTSDSLLDNFGF